MVGYYSGCLRSVSVSVLRSVGVVCVVCCVLFVVCCLLFCCLFVAWHGAIFDDFADCGSAPEGKRVFCAWETNFQTSFGRAVVEYIHLI